MLAPSTPAAKVRLWFSSVFDKEQRSYLKYKSPLVPCQWGSLFSGTGRQDTNVQLRGTVEFGSVACYPVLSICFAGIFPQIKGENWISSKSKNIPKKKMGCCSVCSSCTSSHLWCDLKAATNLHPTATWTVLKLLQLSKFSCWPHSDAIWWVIQLLMHHVFQVWSAAWVQFYEVWMLLSGCSCLKMEFKHCNHMMTIFDFLFVYITITSWDAAWAEVEHSINFQCLCCKDKFIFISLVSFWW